MPLEDYLREQGRKALERYPNTPKLAAQQMIVWRSA